MEIIKTITTKINTMFNFNHETKSHFFSGGVYFDPVFNRLRKIKSPFKIPKEKKEALEKSISNGKKLENGKK